MTAWHWADWRHLWLAQGVALVFLLAACAKPSVVTVPPPHPVFVGYEETGTASWYGEPYHGRQTRQRRGLRHVSDDGGPSPLAVRQLGGRREPAQPADRRSADHGPRPLHRGSNARSLTGRRASSRRGWTGHTSGSTSRRCPSWPDRRDPAGILYGSGRGLQFRGPSGHIEGRTRPGLDRDLRPAGRGWRADGLPRASRKSGHPR